MNGRPENGVATIYSDPQCKDVLARVNMDYVAQEVQFKEEELSSITNERLKNYVAHGGKLFTQGEPSGNIVYLTKRPLSDCIETTVPVSYLKDTYMYSDPEQSFDDDFTKAVDSIRMDSEFGIER